MKIVSGVLTIISRIKTVFFYFFPLNIFYQYVCKVKLSSFIQKVQIIKYLFYVKRKIERSVQLDYLRTST